MEHDSPGPCRLKIVHLITDLDTGGAEMMLAKLVAAMDRGYFSNTVISLTDHGTLGADIAGLGVPVFTLGMRRGVPDPIGIGRLVRLLRQEQPDILQTWLYHADLIGTAASRLARVPVLSWNIRCSDMDMSRYSRLSRLVLQALAWSSGLPDIVVANSEAGRQLHEKLGYTPRRWQIIANGFDLERFRPDLAARGSVREELGMSADTTLIGLVARYDPMKDHQTFLEAAAQVTQMRQDIHFLLAGKGVEALVGQVDALRLSKHVHLLGERRDIPRLVAALDVFALSSAFGEGFPNVVGEAMACGIPCVVTDVGDAPGIVGDTGIVVPPREPGRMADGWMRLLSMSIEERRELGRAARQRVEEHFSIQTIVQQYESLYRGIAGRQQSS